MVSEKVKMGLNWLLYGLRRATKKQHKSVGFCKIAYIQSFLFRSNDFVPVFMGWATFFPCLFGIYDEWERIWIYTSVKGKKRWMRKSELIIIIVSKYLRFNPFLTMCIQPNKKHTKIDSYEICKHCAFFCTTFDEIKFPWKLD